MTSEKRNKLNQLFQVWTQNTVATSIWLESQGVYQQLVSAYEKSGWVKRIGQGAFMRVGDKVQWMGALHTLQKQVGLAVYVAERSAIEMTGRSHFLPLGEKRAITLWGKRTENLPAWFKNFDWKVSIDYKTSTLFPEDINLGFTEKEFGEFSIKVSSPERAIIELLSLVPQKTSFEEAKLLMEGAATFRVSLVQKLLEKCSSVKAKRLFLFLAEATRQPWFERLSPKNIDLGVGKRQIVLSGSLDPKYNITVPHDYLINDTEKDKS